VHVGLNVLHLVPGETGGGETYVRRLVPALLGLDAGLRLTLFAASEAYPSLLGEPWAADVSLLHVPVHARSRTRRVLAEQTLLPRAARKNRVDLLHNTLNTAPVFVGVPQVTTIHDVIYKRFPETAGRLNIGVAVLVPLAARRSSLILTDSDAARQDIVELLDVDAARVAVTPLGPGLPEPDRPLAEEEVRNRLGLGDEPIVLTVAAKRPHKNLGRLLDAFGRIQTDGVLVLPGFETSYEAELRARAGARVRFVGWLDDRLLDGLYRAASCFVLPSLAEGFGLPVLEAMVRGAPVACSDIAPLREVAGDAALFFDPRDPGSIASVVARCLENAELRARLSTAGRERARRYPWSRTAETTLAGYERALHA
jgi:glycosyltransferase involved in cell wall biosynthesis